MKVLITGGAGFIGSHLADELLAHGYQVRALDCLDPQVHGPQRKRPDYLNDDVELVIGDVRDKDDLARALDGIDAVYHFAAAVGVGQSMYEIAHYTSVNNLGTAQLLELLSRRPVERLVVASSMSIYGEGAYHDADGNQKQAVPRDLARLRDGDWEPRDGEGMPLVPMPTPETKLAEPSSVYALSKWDQERLCMIVGSAYRVPTVAMRFFNAYGPRQALSNPYTGVLAIFASRYLNQNPPTIFEDGHQRRDFVHVSDVARACRLALETPAAAGEVFNVGSGVSSSVREVAEVMAKVLGVEGIESEVTRQYRTGDIRHCFADINKAQRILGYEPAVSLRDGIDQLAGWLAGQFAEDSTEEARHELLKRGLAV